MRPHRAAHPRHEDAKPGTCPASSSTHAAGTKGRIARGRNGFTLIEVIIALALFALIGVAGFSMLSGVLQTQERTDGRLRRLSDIQRAVFVISADLDQVSGRIDGDGSTLTFQKTDLSGRPVVVRYALRDAQLFRTVSGPLGERDQAILNGVRSLGWTYHQRGLGWSPSPPAPPAPLDPLAPPGFVPPPPPPPVQAVAMDLRLLGVDGREATLRRVIRTPELAP